MGVRLVDRSSRHLDLTPAGETFLGHGRAILARLEAALADTRAVERPPRLGYTCAVLGKQSVPLLRSWRQDHPEVCIGAAGTAESYGHPGVCFVVVDDAPAATVYAANPCPPTHPRTEEFLAEVRKAVSV